MVTHEMQQKVAKKRTYIPDKKYRKKAHKRVALSLWLVYNRSTVSKKAHIKKCAIAKKEGRYRDGCKEK